jgi:hypothetical protein
MKIFTKTFFELSPYDQAAIVDSVIHDLESAHFVDKEGRRKAARMIRRITKKAIEFGIYADDGAER